MSALLSEEDAAEAQEHVRWGQEPTCADLITSRQSKRYRRQSPRAPLAGAVNCRSRRLDQRWCLDVCGGHHCRSPPCLSPCPCLHPRGSPDHGRP